MILLSVNNIKKTYGEKVILNDISLSIDSQDKIGIIGINGTGKSSLLKMMAGIEVADEGEVTTSNELAIEYLPQNPYFDEGSTVLEQVFKGTSPVMQVLREYEIVSEALNVDPENQMLQNKLMSLSVKMDAQNAWQLESEAKAVLMELGITHFNQCVSELSGGQRKKIALAGALIRPCNLLILDEPTNHLDNDTIDYLETLLKAKKTALIMVTHDRYFLERVTNKIVEIDNGNLYKYDGNYASFLEQKAQRESNEKRLQEKNMSLYKKELEWMRKGVEARRTKQKARQERFYELEDRLNRNNKDEMEIGLGSSRLGKKIIEIKDVSKTFDEKCVIKDFTYTVLRGDRIGIIGNNGMGKSTLLNLITEHIKPDTGTIDIGDTVKIGYYTQESKDMDPKQRVIDYIKEKAEYIKSEDGTMVSASKMLERFLFPSLLHYTPIEKLSGGERRRLYLLGILMEDINVLLLDEPTNDLDIYTLQILEDYIDSFNGPVIAVSHDRYFLDRVVDKIFAYEGEGHIVSCPGSYSDYRFRKEAEKEEVVKEVKKEASTVKRQKSASTKLKFTYNEQKEFDSIDQVIEELEERISNIEKDMATYATHFSKLQELSEEKEAAEAELMEKMDRWEYLNELHERILNQ